MLSDFFKNTIYKEYFYNHNFYNDKMIKTIKRYIPFSCIVASLFIISFGVSLFAAENTINSMQKTVESFLELSSEGKITRVELYYMDWGALTDIAITENFLIDKHYDCKVIVTHPDISDFKKSLEVFEFKTAEKHLLDFRLGCIFFAEDREILRLFFANNIPVVTINKIPFKTTPELIKTLLPLLPIKAYQEINDVMVTHWVFSWPAPIQQKPPAVKQ